MSTRSRRLTAALAATILLLAIGGTAAVAVEVAPTTATGMLPLRDRFETGLGDWRLVTDGTGAITTDRGKTGRGMLIAVPAGAGNRAFARYELTQGTNGVVASAWFRVLRADCDQNAGWSKGSVPFFRIFDTAGERIAGVFAVKTPCRGARTIFVQHSYGNYYPTSGRVALGAWNRIQLAVTVTTPGRSLVEVRVNGRVVYRTTTAANGVAAIGSIQLGNEHIAQSSRIVVDDVAVSARAATAPTEACTPTTPAPVATQPVGTPVIASAFEDRTLADWDVRLAGTATATVDSSFAHDGTCALHLRSDRGPVSRAMLWTSLTEGSTQVAAEGWFLVQREGAARSNVPYIRIMRGATRVVDVYRQNIDGMLWLDVPGRSPLKLGVRVPLGEWHQVAVRANATAGTVEVWLDGTLRTTAGATFAIGTGALTRVILGNEKPSQVYDLWIDGVVISSATGG